jgi:hypothetical protein
VASAAKLRGAGDDDERQPEWWPFPKGTDKARMPAHMASGDVNLTATRAQTKHDLFAYKRPERLNMDNVQVTFKSAGTAPYIDASFGDDKESSTADDSPSFRGKRRRRRRRQVASAAT